MPKSAHQLSNPLTFAKDGLVFSDRLVFSDPLKFAKGGLAFCFFQPIWALATDESQL